MTKNITWAPLVPLIGGQMIGAEQAFGKPPEAIYSFEGFADNDSHYVNYQNVTKGRDIEYVPINNEANEGRIYPKVDVIGGTPPCAALSQLNTGKSEESKGAGCAKNEWMYEVFKEGIDRFGAKVVVVENAPALYTTKGAKVANNLFKICEERGYSLSLYKTSTKYHGVPQARDRTFAIGWKSETAPIMDWYKRDRKNLAEYLDEVPDGALHQDIVINPKIINDPYYLFVQHKNPNEDARKVMIAGNHKTAFNFVNKNGYLPEALQWFKDTDNEKGVKMAEHAIMKFSKGLGIWDGSTHVFNEYMNAVIGRNMVDTIHPSKNRSLTVREVMYLMALPMDFELLHGIKKLNHVAQNVPVCTSADIHRQIKKFLNGELPMSETNYLRQNNHTEIMIEDILGTNNRATLEEFFTENA